ncbi:MAG: glycosyltransferase [Rhodovibrionaceae bacterium]
MTLISVVMPTYNRVRVLPRAIDSVLNQSHGAVELIVVDDGSTDGTQELMQNYAGRLVYLKLDSNRGGNYARNRGIETAQGEIVSFIDSDDEFLPHKLAAVHAFFEDNPDIDLLVDSFEIRYPPEHNRKPTPRPNPVLYDREAIREAVFSRGMYKSTPSLSVRRQALLDIGLFDETLRRRQDMDLILRLTRRHSCASTDQVLWIKHWTPGAISSKQNTFMQALIEICERHPEYLSEPVYRRGLDRDVGRHFVRLIKAGEYSAARRDARRYRKLDRSPLAPWPLVLRYLAQRRKRRG